MKHFTFFKLLAMFSIIGLISGVITMYSLMPNHDIELEMLMEDGNTIKQVFDGEDIESIHIDSIQLHYQGRYRYYMCKKLKSGFDHNKIMRIGVKKFKIIE